MREMLKQVQHDVLNINYDIERIIKSSRYKHLTYNTKITTINNF
jgi:hypothetical protein